jgi:hypothetical protein
MKYLVPLALTIAPLCPATGLSSFAAVAVFSVGVLLAFAALGKDDVPFYVHVENNDYGDCCDGE